MKGPRCYKCYSNMWEHTQSSASCQCVPTNSLRFRIIGCRVEIRNCIFLDSVQRRRDIEVKFKITEYIIKKSARFAGTFSSRASRASLSAPRARDSIAALRARSCAFRIHLSLFLII